MVERQGGDAAVIDQPDLLPGGCKTTEFTADQDGYVSVTNCRDIGIAALVLGAGRRTVSDTIDPAVGLVMQTRVGDRVSAGQPLATIYYRSDDALKESLSYLEGAVVVTDKQPLPPTLILEKIT
jgi:thymidine phosphorylase